MTRRAYVLVFPSGSAWLLDDAKPVAAALDDGDGFYALDGNIGFIKTGQKLTTLINRLKAGPIGSGSFFLTEVHEAESAGNMPTKFWGYLRTPEDVVKAAE